MLKPNQHRAIGLLAMGHDVFQVARLCGCDRSTIFRWQQLDEFKQARDLHMAEMMGAMNPQIQATSREFIEANLDAVRVLRQLALDPSTPPAVRRAACNDIARHAGRWYDLMGFNAKFQKSKKLIVDTPQSETAEVVPDEPCRASDDELEAAAEAERRDSRTDFSPRRRGDAENGTENGMGDGMPEDLENDADPSQNVARAQRIAALQAEPMSGDEIATNGATEFAHNDANSPEPQPAGAGMYTNGSTSDATG